MKNYFSLLDPLRFGAALSVAVFHLTFWSWAWSSVFGVAPGFEHYVAADLQFPSAAPFTWFGWVGVEIFFVISGFVIANSASRASATEFLFGRALRLYPAVWVCSTLTFIVLLLFASGSASEFILPYIRAMLLIPKGIRGQWLDCIYWTLAAEMAFYGLVFCALLTKKVTLRHLAWGLTIYSAVFNAFAMLVLSGVIQSDILYYVVLMFRVPCAAWLLCHGCFFALGIWLFSSANRKLTSLEWLAVAGTCLSGCAEIYYFSSFLLTNIPAISDQSAFVPIVVWAAAVFLIAVTANRSRRSAVSASPEAAGYLRTLGLITYPLYLTHNIVGSAIIRVLIDAGLDVSLALWAGLGMLVLICWFICEKIEPAIRRLLSELFSRVRLRPKTAPPSSLPDPHPGLRLLPIRVRVGFTEQ
ncbi:acyltransferase family protein [Bradyrhizobium sp.]|uniref:acyltransferase family protein n=1 Tax=Bradyrhizobium sp. TaxID=376 RepID=UPI002B6A8EBB|nr:acyltransferase [Bradyrhizobium sp.]HMM89790.1 acyltransferase [Bradyrhizobium sp.]